MRSTRRVPAFAHFLCLVAGVLASFASSPAAAADEEPAQPSTPEQGPPAPAEKPSPVRPALNWVHVDADRSVRLESLDPVDSSWRLACMAPCDRELPTDRPYRVTADGMRTSQAAPIVAAPGERVFLQVSPASQGLHTAGAVLAATGLFSGLGGGVLMFGGFFVALGSSGGIGDGNNANPGVSNAAGTVAEVGVFVVLAGAATAVVGGILYVATLKPTTLSPSTEKSEPASPGVSRDARGLFPAWREASPEVVGLPKVASVPLFSVAF